MKKIILCLLLLNSCALRSTKMPSLSATLTPTMPIAGEEVTFDAYIWGTPPPQAVYLVVITETGRSWVVSLMWDEGFLHRYYKWRGVFITPREYQQLQDYYYKNTFRADASETWDGLVRVRFYLAAASGGRISPVVTKAVKVTCLQCTI